MPRAWSGRSPRRRSPTTSKRRRSSPKTPTSTRSRRVRVSNVAAHAEPVLLPQFDDRQQQDDTTKLGMWTFLATEVMFFGGMFTAYILFRWMYHGPFAEGSNELYMWFGFFNTGVLLCSSLSMALAVDHAKLGNLRPLLRNLVITMILGSIFLGVKAIEYTIDYREHLIPGLNFDPEHL